jgi:hypothetical protein
MAAKSSKKHNPKLGLTKLQPIPEKLFQLPPNLVWKRTFLESRKDNCFRSNSAPAKLTSSSESDSCCVESLGEGECDYEALSNVETTCESSPSAKSFGTGDTVVATSDFRIGGKLAVEKGCRGTVMCLGERPDGSIGVSVQFEKWKKGKAANVLCQVFEVQVVEKAPSAESFKRGEIVAATSDFSIGGVVAVPKGCRGKVLGHGERPDGSIGISVQFEARRDGRDANVLCQPYEIQSVRIAARAQQCSDAVCKGVYLVKQYLDRVWTITRSAIRSHCFSSSFRRREILVICIVAIFSCILFLPSIPATEKVIVEDTEVYSQKIGSAQLNRCVPFVRNYKKIRSKKNITVCGTQTKVILFLRNKCEAYSHYQDEIGTCNMTETSSHCVSRYQDEIGTCNTTAVSGDCVSRTPGSENSSKWHGQAQSYRIERCPGSVGIWDLLWQHVQAPSTQRFLPCFFAGSLLAKIREMGGFESLASFRKMFRRRLRHIYGHFAIDK